jgi:hypothetical protein
MTSRWAVLLVLAAGSASFPTVRADGEMLSRFDTRPARPLGGDDLRVSLSVPVRLDDLEGDMARRSFDLRDKRDLAAYKESLVQLRQLGEAQDDDEERHPERILPFAYDVASSGRRRALSEMVSLTDRLLAAHGPIGPWDASALQLLELHHAIENGFRFPVKKNYEVIPEILPGLLLQLRSHETVGLADPAGPRDATAADPPASKFWSPPGPLSAKDLHRGFGRSSIPVHDEVCRYLRPKTGWGAHPGFHVSCGGVELRFKIGNEIYGGPFNSRVFDALGYHTFAIDRMDGLKLAYDRRVFTEYHSRRFLAIRARLLFIPIAKHVVTQVDDPFGWIAAAVLKDGSQISGDALKRGLLRDTAVVKGRPRPETVAANYDPAFERRIAYLVWKPATVAYEPEDVKPIGAWDYDQLDHAARREVRGVFLLSAWLDQYNMRWENTRLAYVRQGGGWVVRHLFSDVGSGLGNARTLLDGSNSNVEAMRWEVTESRHGRVRFSGFAPKVTNRAFQQMTAEDARWMLRKLCALSERQVLEALLATSMSAAEVRLGLEKLLSKRQKMAADFGLSSEFPDVARRRIDRILDFDPARPEDRHAVTLTLADGTIVVPPSGDLVVRGGHLVHRDGRPFTPATSALPA